MTPKEIASKLIDTWVTENGIAISSIAYARLVAMVIRALRMCASEMRDAYEQSAAFKIGSAIINAKAAQRGGKEEETGDD